MAQDCEQPKPPGNFYCSGAVELPEPTGLDALMVDLLTGIDHVWDTIVGGTPSTDRRSTVFVSIVGVGYCSGVIIGPHTILTAGHCNNGTTDNNYRIYLDRNLPNYYQVTGHLIHPDYFEYQKDPANSPFLGFSDLMLLYVNETLPEPYTDGFYSKAETIQCSGLVAQGWGKTEATTDPGYVPCPDGKSSCLRETPYTVFLETDTSIKTKGIPGDKQGFICFGDSGGPLYAIKHNPDMVELAGITSTTASTDCKVSSTHVKVSNFVPWIVANINGPST